MNIQDIIQRIKKEEVVEERTVKKICKKVQEILLSEANVQYLSSPVNLVGDIHGQFYDLQKLLTIAGHPPTTRYVFIGDFVDRGYHSLETILLLFSLKILHPNDIYLLRGNHESRQISCTYGFHEEVMRKYGSSNVWRLINETFDFLPLSAVIDNHIFCVHGGLSPEIHAIDQIRELNRLQEIPTEGSFGDLMWSDPEDIEGWVQNNRGVGWLFGPKVVNEFNHLNGLSLIARAHQLVQSGYDQLFANKNIVTIWSAPNYCYRCKNLASYLKVGPQSEKEFVVFEQDERSMESVHYSNIIPYFL